MNEDSAEWEFFLAEQDKQPIEICSSCGRQIALWHCGETGCSWCRACGLQPKMRVRN